jgi:curved DNA-binding protein CbpA
VRLQDVFADNTDVPMPKANPDAFLHGLSGMTRAGEKPHVRVCDHPDCAEAGEFRAPKARNRLNEYYWFCLEHVRDYNKAWNYYDGMSDNEVEEDIRRSTTWNRPSWPFGTMKPGQRANGRVKDPFGFMGDDEDAAETRRRTPADTPEGRAYAVLGLEPPLTLDRLKARYKELVKKHHPDANGGDKAAEERLKSINEAYTTLRRFLT